MSNIGYLITGEIIPLVNFPSQGTPQLRVFESNAFISPAKFPQIQKISPSAARATFHFFQVCLPPCLTPLSHPIVTPPCLHLLTHPLVSPPCLTTLFHPCVLPLSLTPMSHPFLSPPCLTSLCPPGWLIVNMRQCRRSASDTMAVVSSNAMAALQ